MIRKCAAVILAGATLFTCLMWFLTREKPFSRYNGGSSRVVWAQFTLVDGRLYLFYDRPDPEPGLYGGPSGSSSLFDPNTGRYVPGFEPSASPPPKTGSRDAWDLLPTGEVDWVRAGFEMKYHCRTHGKEPWVEAAIPLWSLVVLFGLYPALRCVAGPLRRYRRRKRGLCLECGYDLTGNASGVCPECAAKVGA